MSPLLEQLLAQSAVITDGAWGTELQARGLAIGEFPDTWNLRQPDRVSSVARAYVEAGSQVILTNTFGANLLRLREAGLEHELAEINRTGVWISREAAQGKAAVFASIGPSGKLLINGNVTGNELQRSFAAQADALTAAGADALVVETMSDLEEARIAVTAARATGLPVVACMVFDSGREKDRTMMGDTPEKVADALAHAGADVLGTNCGQGIATMGNLCERLKRVTSLPLWFKPNAGLPEIRHGRAHYNCDPEQFGQAAAELVSAGAKFIGACCGSNPEFIRAIQEALKVEIECT